MGIRQLVIALRSPAKSLRVECVVGSLYGECLDLVIVFNEQNLRRLLRRDLVHYNATRPHQSLHNNCPICGSTNGSEHRGKLWMREKGDVLFLVMLSRQTPKPRCHPGQRYATHVGGYHSEGEDVGGRGAYAQESQTCREPRRSAPAAGVGDQPAGAGRWTWAKRLDPASRTGTARTNAVREV
jgi:hypothetical protein